MARRRGSFIEDVISVTAKLPWWVGVVFAALSFALMRWLAAPDVPAAGSTRPPGAVIGSSVSRGLATAGQVLLPLVFLVGAGISLFQSAMRKRGSSSGTPISPVAEPTPRAPAETDRDLYPEWKEVEGEALRRDPVDTTRWSHELLCVLEWKRFEHLCAAYFRELDFRTRTTRAGPDGGVDIHLYTTEASAPSIVVQCKAWKSYKVGVKAVRELFGVMAADKVDEGIFVTTSTYTNEARQFGDGKNVHLIDGDDFLAKLLALPQERQQALLTLATEGDFTTPTCPSCGIKMVLRSPKDGGDPFWGCRSFPGCRATIAVSQSPS